jgi:hypothetical protein
MRAVSLTPLLLLVACGGGDYSRPGTWKPAGVNDRNIQVMLADPAHATRGAEAQDERGTAGTVAIDRLLHDRVRRLPSSGRASAASGGATGSAQGNSDAR